MRGEAVVDGLVLRHEADRTEPPPELSGHFHPKLRLTVRGRRVARRCFVATPTKLILPAFGALTGGLDANHPEIVRAVGEDAEAWVAGPRPPAALSTGGVRPAVRGGPGVDGGRTARSPPRDGQVTGRRPDGGVGRLSVGQQ